MTASALRNQLREYAQSSRIWDEERSGLAKMDNFLAREPNAYARSCLEGHMTASAWILHANRKQFLLTHHAKLGMWLQLGGHADGDTHLERVAQKEAWEESGIEGLELVIPEIFDIDVHLIPAHKNTPAHTHFDVRFLLQAPPGAQFVVSPESLELAWLSGADLADLKTDASVRRMSRKAEQLFSPQ